jgi:hypothetical protein
LLSPKIWYFGKFYLFLFSKNLGCYSRATLGCGQALAPLRLIFGLRDALGKIAGLTFVLSNSKNISRIAFLKHKNSKKQGTGTVASR